MDMMTALALGTAWIYFVWYYLIELLIFEIALLRRALGVTS